MGTRWMRLLRALGFAPTFVYEKFRAEWSDGQGHVVLDHTPLGDIGEIEGKSRWIDRTASALGLDAKDYITKSYAELFFDWKRKTGSKAENMTFRECGDKTKNRASKRVSQHTSPSSRPRRTAKFRAEACAGSGV